MAGRPPGGYTVVIIPLRTGLCSLDALRFYLWIKRLKDLEKEKDALWSGLEVLEKARLWYVQRLEENRARQTSETRSGSGSGTGSRSGICPTEAGACLLRSRIQRANGSLGSVMSKTNAMGSGQLSVPEAAEDSALRWHNSVLTRKVGDKNRQISLLELEKGALIEELHAC
ncbi:suppressor APC domain-containing protein 1 isoform 2-T2 [Menidia menidia]